MVAYTGSEPDILTLEKEDISTLGLQNANVPCEICKSEVPVSEALNPEGSDYVMYFCGFNCYEKWRKKARNEFAKDISG